ncbi:PAS domain S-box protein [Marinobacterium ramblicola]|uniref:PAS domain S-box protein n=1 Tax=Marinobacterium ramblicola TaxID=2849041 RepID=UPI003CCEA3ED
MYRRFFQQLPTGALICDLERRCIACNDVFTRQTGYQESALVGRDIGMLLLTDDDTVLSACLRSLLEISTPQRIKASLLCVNNSRIECHLLIGSMTNEQGQVESLLLQVEMPLVMAGQHFREVFEYATELLYLLEVTEDDRFRYLEVNRAFEQSTGLPRERLIGTYVGDQVSDLESHVLRQHLRQCLNESVMIEGEAELRLPAGVRIYRWTLVPVIDDNGRPYRIVGLSRDVTEQRRHERKERLQLEIFQSLAHGAPLMLCLERIVCFIEQLCPELRSSVMLVDERARCLRTGPAPSLPAAYLQAVDGIPIAEGVGSCGTAAWRREMVAVENTATHPYFESFRDLTERAGLRACWSEPILDLDGRVLGVLAVYLDRPALPAAEHLAVVRQASNFCTIAIRRSQAERTLRESEQRHRDIFNNSHDALFLLEVTEDGGFRNIEVNPAFERMIGMSRAELIGKTIDETVPQAVAEVANAKYRRCIAAGKVTEEEVELDLPAGRRILHSTLVPVRDRFGAIYRIVGITRDITEQKARATALQESKTLLRELAARREAELEEERKRIAREVHDELGQLLTSLRLNLNLLAREFGPQLPALGERTKMMRDIVDSTIQSVRGIATELRPAVLDMGITSALDWLVQQFSSHSGIVATLDMDDEIKLDDARAVVVFRVAQESLTNVVRHAQAERVKVSLHQCGCDYRLSIEDDGVGFDTGEACPSHSFGLLGMQERALTLGGTLQLNSEPRRGTRVELVIPMAPGMTACREM